MRKCLVLSKCLNSVKLYSDGMLSLPIPGLVEEFKCAKVRLETSLVDSWEPIVGGGAPNQQQGESGSQSQLQAESALLHHDVVGHVQRGRGGFYLGAVTHLWQQASVTEQWAMVRRREEAARRAGQAGSPDELGVCWKEKTHMEGNLGMESNRQE